MTELKVLRVMRGQDEKLRGMDVAQIAEASGAVEEPVRQVLRRLKNQYPPVVEGLRKRREPQCGRTRSVWRLCESELARVDAVLDRYPEGTPVPSDRRRLWAAFPATTLRDGTPSKPTARARAWRTDAATGPSKPAPPPPGIEDTLAVYTRMTLAEAEEFTAALLGAERKFPAPLVQLGRRAAQEAIAQLLSPDASPSERGAALRRLATGCETETTDTSD